MDNKPVHILLTIPSSLTTCTRRVKTILNAVEVWQDQQFFQPTHIKLYNRTMGGTDADDQMLSYYRPKVKTVSHAPRLFIHMLSTSLVNAYIIFVERNNLRRLQYRFIDFLNAVINQWTEPWSTRLALGEAVLPNPVRAWRRQQWNAERSRLLGRHDPLTCVEVRIESRGRFHPPMNRNLVRGHCIMCTQSCNVQCQQCHTYLCIRRTGLQQEINDPTCWVKFHTWADLNYDPDLNDNDNNEIDI